MNEADSGKSASGSRAISCSIRYCFYLHLGSARRNGKMWPDHFSRHHPIFDVEGKARWVLVYQEAGSDWVQIYQLTSKNKTVTGKTKPNHVPLGRIIPNKNPSIAAKQSWVQCIPERYPTRLIDDAETVYHEKPIPIDPNVANIFLKAIMAKSPQNWTPPRP